jgi:hypothetical protein
MSYLAVKHLHMSCAVLTGLLFSAFMVALDAARV